MIGTTSSTGLSISREYDKAGRLIAETDVLGRSTRYEYYPDGKRKKMTDPRGNVFPLSTTPADIRPPCAFRMAAA